MSPLGDVGVATTDRQLVVRSWDEWLVAATSIPREEAVGRHLSTLVPAFDERDLRARFDATLESGVVQVFSSTLHGPLFPCAPRFRSRHFPLMQQRVTIGPLTEGERITGLVLSVQDITAQLEHERDLAAGLSSEDPDVRSAAEAIATHALDSIDAVSSRLRDDDWRVRRRAVDALSATADEDLLRSVLATLKHEHRDFSALSGALKLLAVTDVDLTGPLSELLRDEDVDLRIQAALALGEQPYAAAVPPLMMALEDADANVRFHAIEALGRLRAAIAVDPLLSILESGDFFLGFAAIDALAAIGDSRIAPRLTQVLGDPTFREPAADALARLGDERAIAPLVRVLNEEPDAAVVALSALFAISERVAQFGLDASAAVRESLSDAGRRHVIAAAQDAPPNVRPAVARALGWIGDADATRALGPLLMDPDARVEATAALVRIGEAAIDVLIERLQDEDNETRTAAIGALGAVGSRRATAALIPLLCDSRIALAVCGALARIGDPDAFEPLLELIGHRDGALRVAAVGALNSIGHPRMPEVVVPLLGDASPFVRESAVRIAGYFGYPEAKPLVEAHCSDPDEIVRVAALEALPYFDEAAALPALENALANETPKCRVAAVHALARIDSEAVVPLLVRALTDRDAWVRYFAARALSDRDAAIGRDELLKAAESDPSPPVRVAALQALGSRGPDLPLAPLLRAAEGDNSDIASAALVALGGVAAAEATTVIRAATRHSDPVRRKAAVQALRLRGNPEAVADLEWIAAADSDAGVAASAVQMLSEVATSSRGAAPVAVEALIALLADADRADWAIAAIARLPLHLVEHVGHGLTHVHPVVRRRTVDALARYRHPDATRLLARAFADEDAGVRQAAADAVLHLGSRAFDDTLEKLASLDPSEAVRRAARTALAGLRPSH